MARTKINSCIILNPPETEEEQRAYSRKVSKALALALYRSLSPQQFDLLIEKLGEGRGGANGDT